MTLTVITDSGDVDVPNATSWRRESDGSRVLFDEAGNTIAEFDRENFVGITREDSE